MRLQERLPGRPLAPLRRRRNPVLEQNPLHRVSGDLVAEVGQGTSDTGVPPPRIVDGHSHDQLGHRLGCQWPPAAAAGAAVVLLGDQLPIPAQDRVRRDDAGHLGQDPSAEFLAAHGETTPLSVSQAERTTAQLLSEDSILLTEIVDQIFLVTVQPASNREDEEVQRVGHPMRLPGSSRTCVSRCRLLSAEFWHPTGSTSMHPALCRAES